MKLEYDKCEEYWTCKLDDERELFAEEQRAGDERLADLVAKIAEYERQFTPHSTPHTGLPTIDETYSLELQFSDLEDEFTKYKREQEAELKTKVYKYIVLYCILMFKLQVYIIWLQLFVVR